MSAKPEQLKIKQFTDKVYGYLKQDKWPLKANATLTADDLIPSIGVFELSGPTDWPAHFSPTDASNPSLYPSHQAVLKVSGIPELLKVSRVQLEATGTGRYQIWVSFD
jgi:hypothetical protein